MTILDALGLLAAGWCAGVLNSVAGGGQFFTFPALLLTGMPAIAANATSSVAVWPGTLASVAAYRRELQTQRTLLIPLGIASVIGGVLGAIVLLHTPKTTFVRLIPWLLLLATLLLAFGSSLVNRLRGRFLHHHQNLLTQRTLIGLSLFQFLIAAYGGFFGGGMGIVMLAAMALIGLDDMHVMNGLKTALASCVNGVAVITFVVAGAVRWPEGIVMVIGALLGGYGGAYYARRLDPKLVRRFAIAVGATMTIAFFVRG